MARHIIMVTWPQESQAYQALSELRASFSDRINQAGVIQRQADGRVQLRDGDSNVVGVGTLGGGALGALVGILGGPLGVLLGFSGGALFGSLVDVADATDDDSVLGAISRQLPPGMTALIADVDENDNGTADALATSSGGNLVRYAYDDVLAEVSSAEAAAQAAATEAARVIRDEKRAERKADREQRWEGLKAKFKDVFGH